MVTENYAKAKWITSAGIVGLVCLLLLGGHINSVLPRVRKLNLSVSNRASKLESLNIVAASDIHMGTIVGRRRIDAIVNKIWDKPFCKSNRVSGFTPLRETMSISAEWKKPAGIWKITILPCSATRALKLRILFL